MGMFPCSLPYSCKLIVCQAVYKFVAAWSRRLLDIAGERVVDVQGNDDDDDDDEE